MIKSFAQVDIEQNGDYLKLLAVLSKLSRLFSESEVPFIQYRIAENVFCRSFNADNLSRGDSAFDANFNSEKTFNIDLPAGIYFAKITSDNQTVTKKIVAQ